MKFIYTPEPPTKKNISRRIRHYEPESYLNMLYTIGERAVTRQEVEYWIRNNWAAPEKSNVFPHSVHTGTLLKTIHDIIKERWKND